MILIIFLGSLIAPYTRDTVFAIVNELREFSVRPLIACVFSHPKNNQTVRIIYLLYYFLFVFLTTKIIGSQDELLLAEL